MQAFNPSKNLKFQCFSINPKDLNENDLKIRKSTIEEASRKKTFQNPLNANTNAFNPLVPQIKGFT
jgi:hypothetical protein